MNDDNLLPRIEARLAELLLSKEENAEYRIQRIGGLVYRKGGLALLDEMADRIDPTSRLSWLWWESFDHKPLLDELVGHARRALAHDDEAARRIGGVLLAVGGWDLLDRVAEQSGRADMLGKLWGERCDTDELGATILCLEDVLDATGEHQRMFARLLALRLLELGGLPLFRHVARDLRRGNPARRELLARVWTGLLEGGSDE